MAKKTHSAVGLLNPPNPCLMLHSKIEHRNPLTYRLTCAGITLFGAVAGVITCNIAILKDFLPLTHIV